MSFINAIKLYSEAIAAAVRGSVRLRELAKRIKDDTVVGTIDDAHAAGKIRWNMMVFGTHQGPHAPEEQNYCGTAACALGLAALTPQFQAEGLQARWSGHGQWKELTVHFGAEDQVAAGAEFFGLTLDEANDIFLGTHRSRSGVIRRIQKYAKDRHALRTLREAGIDYV